MDFRGNKKRGGGGGGNNKGNSSGNNSRFNVTPMSNQDQMNQLLLQQYFLQQQQESGQGSSMAAAAQAAAAAALFGGILGDKLGNGSGGGGGVGGSGGSSSSSREQQINELFAAAAAVHQQQQTPPPPPQQREPRPSSTTNRSQSSTPSPRISSPQTNSSRTTSQQQQQQQALQQLTAALKKDSSGVQQQAAAALAAQQQWMYLDYIQRMQQEAVTQQQQQHQQHQQQQASKRGRSNSRGNSNNNQQQQQRKAPGRPPNTSNNSSQQKRGGGVATDLSRLLDQYNSNSLLKSSVLASAKLPADTEIIVQKNTRGGGVNNKPPQNKRGPKPKNHTITSEQAKFEQQLINLGNNNAITITPANLDMKQHAASSSSTSSSAAAAAAVSQAPITITPAPSNSANNPPPAHSTPFRYGNDKRDQESSNSSNKSAQPAHKYVKELYTHVIPRKPQIGLIGNRKNTINKNKSTGNLNQVKHHRPWMMEHDVMSITPANTTTTSNTPLPNVLNLKETKKFNLTVPKPAPEPIIISPPDYSVPIREGWKREMILKCFDLNDENLSLQCEITYISPEGKVYSSLNEIKKGNINEPKNFTFNSKIQLGRFVLPQSESNNKRFDYEELVEYFHERKQQEALRKKHLRMKQEHNNYVKLLEAYRKNKRKLKLNEKKHHENITPKSSEVEELLDDLDNNIPLLDTVEGKHLNDKTFANMLQIHEFLHTFGETLGFDSESLPSLGSLQKAFLHVEDNEEELVSVLCHLLVCAVEDPGLPNPTGTKHLTPFGQTLKQADVTFGSMSEILRIYLNGISDSEPEAEQYAEWLEVAPFTAQSAYRKSVIVAFICDVLLQNKAVLKYLDNCSELIHNCKKEKQQNEIRVRKLRMLVARKQVAASIEEGGNGGGDNASSTGVGNGGGGGQDGEDGKDENKSVVGDDSALVSAGEDSMMQGDDEKVKDPAYAAVASVADSISSDPDSKLSIEELNSKIQTLGSSSEKLKKQMQNNSKCIRSVCLGQDRWRRRYWNLHYGGGVYIEGGATGEFDEVRDAVQTKFDNNPPQPQPPPQPPTTPPKEEQVKEEDEPVVKQEGGSEQQKEEQPVAKEVKRATPFTVPPPVIKIFSFTPRLGCSGAVPEENNPNNKLTDDELLVKHVNAPYWYDWKCIKKQEDLESYASKLCEKGIREKNLKNQLISCNFKKIPELKCTELDGHACNPEDNGFVDPELLYKIHLGLIETLETLEERVASASLQVKGWVLPNRNLIQENLSEEKIIEIVKERVLDLENAIERRYLKPPLGKSGLEVNLTQLLKESEDMSYNLLLDGPIGSTSSTRGQQINENNKLKMELKEKERLEKELAMRKEKEEGGGGKGESRFLMHWRDAIAKTTSPSVLSMAIYILDSSIAWDKSVMKASCQLCKGGDNEDKLLLCDACDRGYHTYCFKPPLDNIPDGDWFCWECINKATGNKCCIVCGKGQVPNIKLLCCDKCVKAYHQDCISPPVSKAPRGRWFCPDHREGTEGKGRVTLSQAVNVSMNSSVGSERGGSERERGGGGSCSENENSKSSVGGGGGGSKKSSPKKKKSERSVDGNVSDSSNSSSFVMMSSTPKHEAIVSVVPEDDNKKVVESTTTTPKSSSHQKKKKKSTTASKDKNNKNNEEDSNNKVNDDEVVTEKTPITTTTSSTTSSSSGGGGSSSSSSKISKKMKNEMSWCEKLLDELVGHEDAWPFLEPVNTRQFPTYKKIIKTPMDLQTIKSRLVANHYKNKEAFLQDVRVIFDNCETFNEDDSPVGKAGHSLRVFFESKPGVGTTGNSSSGGNGGGK